MAGIVITKRTFKIGEYIWTQKGHDDSPEHCKEERKPGERVGGIYTDKVPASWVRKGWVELENKE